MRGRLFDVGAAGLHRLDPLIVHVASADELTPLVERVPDAARVLIERFWPGPLSIVLPKRPLVPDIVTSGLPSVTVRCPSRSIAKKWIETAGVPIAARSANLFCSVGPTTAQHVAEQFGDQLSIILDGGPCNVGVESSVVSFLHDRPMLLRPAESLRKTSRD
ncbi:MAG: L-threonylcarbamoyladenylate synthase [Pirellulaceae bacterium]|nr:L-threonylcarbamoyladenylate synthase [Planctomycetales bacterium]